MSKKNQRIIPETVRAKAERILSRIASGTSFRELHGKRMPFNPALVSIPVGGRTWRLLCTYEGNELRSSMVLHHAAYNDQLRRLMRNAA